MQEETMGVKPLLDAAEARRVKIQEKLDKVVNAPQTEGRTALTQDEADKFEKYATELREIDEQIGQFREQTAREAAATAGAAELQVHADAKGVVVRERMTYDEHAGVGGASFMRDLAAIMVPQSGLNDGRAAERMAQHHKELDVEARNNAEARRKLDEARRTPASLRQEQRVNPNTTYGTGGEFNKRLCVA